MTSLSGSPAASSWLCLLRFQALNGLGLSVGLALSAVRLY